MAKRYAVILAAGQGTRMKSNLYKVLHPVVGRPMVNHVIQQLKKISLSKLVTIVGHGAEKVKDAIGEESTFAVQKEQLGTGHAVMQAEKLLKNKQGTTIVVCGDTPLITHQTYEALFQHHEQTEAKATILTTIAKDPTGYGRIIRNNAGEVERIVEHKDANEQELAVTEVNTGTYCFDNELLFKALKEVSNDNAQGEYYLPDVIEILKNKSEKISAYQTMDFDETLGINDRVALAKAEQIMRRRINEYHMRQGVTLVDPSQTYIGLDVTIGQDAIIYPGAMITGKTTIGSYTTIGPQVEINNCQIGNHVNIRQSVLEESVISDYTEVGPYAYIRPGSHIEAHARIGRFVEVKKSKIGQNSKIPHLSYIGDAHIGENVNIGCGTITVNYDGIDKHATIIEDHAFVGCNSNLVAPVTIGKGSYVAAGSTITRDVPEDALGIARSRQSNKENYAKRLRNREHN